MFEQIRRWFSLEAEKHLAPLDSLSFTLSSLQEMRRSLEQFTEEAAVSDGLIVFISRMERCRVIQLVCRDLLFNVSITMCTAPAEAGRRFDAGPQTSVRFHITGAQAAHELHPPGSTHTPDRDGHPDQPL